MTCRLAIDVTREAVDLALRRAPDGRIFSARLTTGNWAKPPLLREAAADIARQAGIALSDIEATVFATDRTEFIARAGEGSRIGLITTAGHEDLLELGRGDTPSPLGGWKTMRPPAPLVSRFDILGASGRLSAQGDILEQPDEAQWRHLLHALLDREVEGIAICLLHAAINPVHEHRLADLAGEMAPGLPVTLSSDVWRGAKEFERANATVLQARLAAGFHHHLRQLDEGLPELAGKRGISLARGDGGLMGVARAAARPLESLSARVAGGAMHAAQVARQCGLDRVLALAVDLDASRLVPIRDGIPARGQRGRLGAAPYPVPAVEHVRAAGGLVRAGRGALGGLQLGPDQSAGPPAGFGGSVDAATLVDALLVLGHLPAQPLGEGPVRDLRNAEQALGALANALDLDLHGAAAGIRDLFLEDLAGRTLTLLRRHEFAPGEVAIVAGGAFGPALAAPLAELVAADRVVVPDAAAHGAAAGFLSAAHRLVLVRAIGKPVAELGAERLADQIASLMAEAGALWQQEAADDGAPHRTLEADLRLRGRERLVTVTLDPERADRQMPAQLAEAFKAAHRARYGPA